MGSIRSYTFTQRFNFEQVKLQAIEKFRAKVLKNAIVIEHKPGYLFVFDYGVALSWDLEDEQHLLQKLAPASAYKISEGFSYRLSSEHKIKISADMLQMNKIDELTMLAVSFAIAQSIKLSEFEDELLTRLQQTEHIPTELAKTGRVNMKRKEIAKERGRLFLTKSKIYLHFELLDTPDFFWEYPELEEYYHATRKYLELNSRIEILNRKLNILHEILTILADEQKHKYSSLLEWIIIILIALEIILFIL